MSEFGWTDYGVFGGLLVASTAIGLLCSRNQGSSAKQFLTASGNMSTVPVALSMLASFLSSITLMGQPAEVYLYGAQQWLFGVAMVLIIPLVGYIIAPFFRQKNYYSAYQYFGERFSRKLQLLASIIFTIHMVGLLALVLYAPALAMNQVTGLNTLYIVTVMYIVCIFYTTVGGMKAVVWTDSFQVVVIFLSMAAIIYKGTTDIGGVDVIWERASEFNRTNFFNWNYEMTDRYTVWSSFIGSGFLHMSSYGSNQLQIQRYLTVSSDKESRKMLWINTIGWAMVMLMCVYVGLLIFATYCYCDPLLTQRILKADQLFPLYVKEVLHNYPGIPGLFLCGIFSAGLSTVSTGINSLAAIWFGELEGTKFLRDLPEHRSGLLVKVLALFFGILSYFMVFVVPHMGGLVPLAVSLTSIFSGSLLGLFILGLFFSKANTWGATVGLLASVTLLTWISLGEVWSLNQGYRVHTPLPSSVAQCEQHVHLPKSEKMEDAFVLYRLSYAWYSMVATLGTIIVGLLVSYLVEACKCISKKSPSNRIPESAVSNLLLNEKEMKVMVTPKWKEQL